jgi:hypothetical protein
MAVWSDANLDKVWDGALLLGDDGCGTYGGWW